ncbi:hypothetical protein ACIQH6_24150 [Micromonospora orduensis]|uniref:hypothetical protein n=1 Tax=Micromonospora orduensis TaxID=1420891 RepID=UPI0038226EC7
MTAPSTKQRTDQRTDLGRDQRTKQSTDLGTKQRTDLGTRKRSNPSAEQHDRSTKRRSAKWSADQGSGPSGSRSTRWRQRRDPLRHQVAGQSARDCWRPLPRSC